MAYFVVMLAVLLVIGRTEASGGRNMNPYKNMARNPGGLSDADLLKQDHNILEKILTNYDCRFGPPGVTVDVRLALLELDVNDDLNKICVNMDFRIMWKDWRLMWNPENFGGVKFINVLTDQVDIWRPDLSVYNSIHPIPTFYQSNYLIYHTGDVMSLAMDTNIDVSCVNPELDLAQYPNKPQNCSLIVASWGFTDDDFHVTCKEKIQLMPNDYRDVTRYKILRTGQPTMTLQSFNSYQNHTYAECVFPIIFQKKLDSEQ